MADSFKFELVSPQRLVLSAHVREVVVPGSEGDFMVLPDHAPFLAMLRPGVLRVPGQDGGLDQIYVRGGIADVSPSGLTVLAEQAIPLTQLSAAMLEREIADATTDLADAEDEDTRRAAGDVLERLESLRAALNLAA
jgi:F-type H+-transporting ATPase subunit epsilon